MIVKKLTIVILWVNLKNTVFGTSISNVFVEREISAPRYYPYNAPYSYTSVTNPQYSQINTLPASVPTYVDPCITPCVKPGQAVSAIRQPSNFFTYNSPYATVPVVIGSPDEESNGYQYSYVVYDQNTGDHKAQRELSDGSVVQGEYSFLQPDGYVRKVQYIADDLKGFNAMVKHYLPVALGADKKVEIKNKNEHSQPHHNVKKESLKQLSTEELEGSSEKNAPKIRQHVHILEHGHGHTHLSERDHDLEHIHELEHGQSKQTTQSRESVQRSNLKQSQKHDHETYHNEKSEYMHYSEHSHESEHGHNSEKTRKSEHGQEPKQGHNHAQSHSSDHKLKHIHENAQMPESSHQSGHKSTHDQNPVEGHSYSHELEHIHKDESSKHSNEGFLKNSPGHSNEQGLMDSNYRPTHKHEINLSQEHSHELQHGNALIKFHNGELGSSQEITKNSKEKHIKISYKHSKEESEEVSYEKPDKKHSKEHKKSSSEESNNKHTEKHKKIRNEESTEDSDESVENSTEHHKKKPKKQSREQSSEESKEELKVTYHETSKKEPVSDHEIHKIKSKKGSKERSSESESAEDFIKSTFHVKHKDGHELLRPEQKVFVPYHDVLRCLQASLRKSYGIPAALREEPSPLTYLVLNKPC